MTRHAKTFAKGSAAAVFVGLSAWVVTQRTSASDMTVTTAETDSLLATDSTVVLLDVRTPGEFNSSVGHLPEAILIPVHELPDRLGELELFKEKTIVVYCRTGRRSGRATSLLNELGFRAFNMIGGMVQWNAEGRPAVREDGQ
ncbi:MAG: rhodanese-like domain-containing protein [Bacteroidota bacterium]